MARHQDVRVEVCAVERYKLLLAAATDATHRRDHVMSCIGLAHTIEVEEEKHTTCGKKDNQEKRTDFTPSTQPPRLRIASH
jgi:hypothetical protein